MSSKHKKTPADTDVPAGAFGDYIFRDVISFMASLSSRIHACAFQESEGRIPV